MKSASETQVPVCEQSLEQTIIHVRAKFMHACAQVRLLNVSIEKYNRRYQRASSCNQKTFRYTNRIIMCTLEGVRNMFYEYASKAANELEDLMQQVNLALTDESEEEDYDDDLTQVTDDEEQEVQVD